MGHSIACTLHPTLEEERVNISKYPSFNSFSDSLHLYSCTCHLVRFVFLVLKHRSLLLSFLPQSIFFFFSLLPPSMTASFSLGICSQAVICFHLQPWSLRNLISSQLSCVVTLTFLLKPTSLPRAPYSHVKCLDLRHFLLYLSWIPQLNRCKMKFWTFLLSCPLKPLFFPFL